MLMLLEIYFALTSLMIPLINKMLLVIKLVLLAFAFFAVFSCKERSAKIFISEKFDVTVPLPVNRSNNYLESKRNQIPNLVKFNYDSEIKKFTEVFTPSKWIKLDDNILIKTIDKIIINKNHLFVLDGTSRAMHVFSSMGRHLWSANKKGNGPGEFFSLKDFVVDEIGHKVYLLDLFKIIEYEINGTYITDYKIGIAPKNIALSKNNEVFYLASNYNSAVSDDLLYTLFAISKKDKELAGNLFSYPIEYMSIEQGLGKYLYQATDGHTNFIKVFNDTIYHLENSTVSPKTILDYESFAPVDKNPLKVNRLQGEIWGPDKRI